MPEAGLKLTPRHYSYLKISEGCNHRCSFCIIPSIRGDLASRRPDAILREAEKLVDAGTKELLVISQDTSAYGVDIRHQPRMWKGQEVRAHMTDLARELGKLGAWVRLHYVYPYPHVDQVIPLMAEGLVLPYLDIPFQHASPSVLKRMKRPANEAKVLERLKNWRSIVPEMAVRSSFVVGFPGETEEDFQYLLYWLEEAQLDRVGAFKFEPVQGAAANALPDHVPEEVKQERYERVMELSARISAEKLAAKVGKSLDVLIDRWMKLLRRKEARTGATSTLPIPGIITALERPGARRPTLRKSTAKSTCVMRVTCRPATSSRSVSRTPTSTICSG